MFFNQLKIALRNFWKNKSFSAINILGLSLGMACCFLTMLYAWHEFNYDTFHTDGDRLYRVEYHMQTASRGSMSRTPPALAPALLDYFPEMEAVARFYPRNLSVALSDAEQQFELANVFFVDTTVTEVFKFDYLQGNEQTAFVRPDAVVLSDETAQKLFGRINVVGESLSLAGEDGFRVSAVVKAWPNNSHLEFTLLAPFNTMIKVEPEHAREVTTRVLASNFTATHSFTYVKLKPNQDPEKINSRFKPFIMEKGHEMMRERQDFSLTPVPAIHLYTDSGGPKPPGNLNFLYIFLLIGGLTLLIACINFINLSTASSMARAKEVGVRKVLGARRGSLILQFLTESMVLSFLSFLLSLLIVYWTLPYFNTLTALEIPFDLVKSSTILLSFIGIFIITGILAGLYPAFFVSRFKAVSILKGKLSNSQKPWNEWLRKGLISVQFLAAIVFITGAITLYLQLQHLRSKSLGFNPELVLSIPLNSANNINSLFRPGDASLRARMNTFDESLASNPKIKAVTQCSHLPGLGAVGRKVWSEKTPQSENMIARVNAVDYDFVETFNLEVLAGRDFDASFGTDHISSFMVNEKAMKDLGWDNPEEAVGANMVMEGKEGNIVGILKDYNFQSLHSEILPMLLEVRPGIFGNFAIQMENSDVPETLAFLESKWNEHFPEKVFEYNFLDDSIDDIYQAEGRLASIIGYFAFLAIFIACFGLFGLAALLTQQRFKEIGIRKVLGATVGQILQLIAKDFIWLIAFAMLLALPVTWYFLKDWLNDFAYRIDFPWWATFVSGLTVMLVAFVTISVQSAKAALSNPVDAIRNE